MVLGRVSTGLRRSTTRLLRPGPVTVDDAWGRERARTRNGRAFRLLLLGGDDGALSQARSYYDRYGVRASVLAIAPGPHHAASDLYQIRYEPEMGSDDGIVDAVNRFAALDDSPVLLSMSFDRYVLSVVRSRDRFASNVIAPYAPVESVELATDKVSFAALAQEMGLAHPRTVVVPFDESGYEPPRDEEVAALGTPFIGKPAESVRLNFLGMDDFEKVYVLESSSHLERVLRRLHEAGFVGDFLLQERIPGPDSQMRLLTCYVDRHGALRNAALAHSVIEEHHPFYRGNPAVILTGLQDQVLLAAVERLLTRLEWVGFVNFDIKVDPRDGSAVVFELNPRLGRSNYYLNISGFNPIEVLAEDWVGGDLSGVTMTTDRRGMYSIVPVPLALAYGQGSRPEMVRSLLARRVANPLIAPRRSRRDLSRTWYMWLDALNQVRRFHTHYPLSQQRRERDESH